MTTSFSTILNHSHLQIYLDSYSAKLFKVGHMQPSPLTYHLLLKGAMRMCYTEFDL